MKGMTLIETLLTILILSFIIGGIYSAMTSGSLTFPIELGMLDLEQQARSGMDRMVRFVRQSSSANTTISADLTSITFSIHATFIINSHFSTSPSLLS